MWCFSCVPLRNTCEAIPHPTTPIAMADKPIDVEVPAKDPEKEESKSPSPPDGKNPEEDETLVEMVRGAQSVSVSS